MSDKDVLRKRLLELRNQLPPQYIEESSRAICQKLREHPFFQQSNTIAFYMPFRNEVDVRPLMELAFQLGKQVVLPRVERKTRQLQGYRVDSMCDCQVGAYGILEPPEVEERLVKGEELEAVIVPGVAFDLQGFRLGYGGGYYDRWFAGPLKAWRIGVAYPEQIVPTVYPEPHDQPLHLLVSSQQEISFAK